MPRNPLALAFTCTLLATPAASLQVAETPSVEASRVDSPRARVVAITMDGKQVAAGWEGGLVTLLSGDHGEIVRKLEPRLPADPWALGFSPDGHRLAVLDHDGSLRIWDLEEGAASTPERALPLNGEIMRKYDFGSVLSWSPTGERFVIGDDRGNNSLWNAAGVEVAEWTVADPPGNAQLVWSNEGKRLLTADGSLLVFRAADSGEPWRGERGVDFPVDRIDCRWPIVSLALHHGGEIVATGHTTELVQVWSLWTGELQWTARFPHPWSWCVNDESDDETQEPEDCDIGALAFSPVDDRLALSTRESAFVYVVDGLEGRRLWTSEWLGADWGDVLQLVWSPKAERLWFAFECGWRNLYAADPSGSCQPQTMLRSSVPRFGRNAGVICIRDLVMRIHSDGAWYW